MKSKGASAVIALLIFLRLLLLINRWGNASSDRHTALARNIAHAQARGGDPVQAVKQELAEGIDRYRRGEASALPFLSESSATNISVVRVVRSGNTNLPSVLAELLVDGKRQYFETPISIYPPLFLKTFPPAPTEDEIREHINEQVQRSLRGEKSDLRLSSYYHWSNITIESIILPTNLTFRWPHEAEVVLLAQGPDPDTGAPLQRRIGLEIRYMDEDNWFVIPKQTNQKAPQ